MKSAPAREALALTPRSAILFAAGAILAALAVAVRSPVPLLTAIPLLLAPAASTLWAPKDAPKARMVWTEFGGGAEVLVRGRLELDATTRPQDLSIVFYHPEPLIEVKAPKVELGPSELRVSASYAAPYPCLASMAVPEVRWRDPLGLVERPVQVIGSPLRVERFPPEVARVGSVRLRRTTLLPGEIRSRSVGSPGEFFGVRAARPTDSPRRINWQATARLGRPMANDYFLERTGDLLIVLDLRPTSLGPAYDRPLLAISKAAALGMASSFLAEKARVGLATFAEFVSALPLSTGRLQRLRIARALETADLSAVSGPPERLAVSLRRYFPPGVTTVLLSPLADEEAGHLLPHLRRRGFPVFVLSPSPLPILTRRADPPDATDEMVGRLLRLVRRQRVAEVWEQAPVVEWENYWSLAPLVNFLTSPLRNPRAA